MGRLLWEYKHEENGRRNGMEALGGKYIWKNESIEFSVWLWGQWKEVGEVYNDSEVLRLNY